MGRGQQWFSLQRPVQGPKNKQIIMANEETTHHLLDCQYTLSISPDEPQSCYSHHKPDRSALSPPMRTRGIPTSSSLLGLILPRRTRGRLCHLSHISSYGRTIGFKCSMEVVVGNCEQKKLGSSEVSEKNTERFQFSCSGFASGLPATQRFEGNVWPHIVSESWGTMSSEQVYSGG